MKILVAEFRKMFSGDHGKPSTEALCNYDVHFDRGVDYVADDVDAVDDGYHENDDDSVGGAND